MLMSLATRTIGPKDSPDPGRVTKEMRKSIVYQNKSSRGSGRIEAAKGNGWQMKRPKVAGSDET